MCKYVYIYIVFSPTPHVVLQDSVSTAVAVQDGQDNVLLQLGLNGNTCSRREAGRDW